MAESGPLLRPLEAAGTAAQRRSKLGSIRALRILGDGLAVVAGAFAGYAYRFHLSGVPIPGGVVPALAPYVEAVPVVVALWLLIFAFTGRYRGQRGQSFADELLGAAGSVALFVILALALEGLVHNFPYSRLVLADASVAAVILFVLERAAIRALQGSLLRRGHGSVRVLVVGTGPVAELLLRRLRMFPEYGYSVVGQVAVEEDGPLDALSVVPLFRLDQGLTSIIRQQRADQLLLALSGADHQRVVELARAGLEAGAEVKVVPDVLEIMTSAARTEEVAGLPLVGLQPSRLVGFNLVMKRGFDLLMTLVLAVAALPLVAICSLAIMVTSPGSPFYKQERLGLHGKPFYVWKLRSMVKDAEVKSGPVMASLADSRTTRVGRFVRRFSLDELPQLWNVVLGEMSLVGPRPERAFFAAQFAEEVPRYRERLQVAPGCTGWAQVNDLRQGTSIEERIFYDIYYVENWSLGFDLKILLLTPWRILGHRHAY